MDWHYEKDGNPEGPVSEEDVREESVPLDQADAILQQAKTEAVLAQR